MFKYGIIGFGGLGKKHLCNLIKLEEKRKDFKLAAICGTTEADAKKGVQLNLGSVDVSKIDFSECNFYEDYKDMFENEELDFVLSVFPTHLHEEVAVYALSRGVNVFSEKPMALTLEGCENMINTANKNNKKLMIGQCLRFHPGYQKIKEFIDSKKFGNIRGAYFERNSQMPLWTFNNWILDSKLSGGCVVDMHIHDVDLIHWLFGKPNAVQSHARSTKIDLEGVSSCYHYSDFIVYAEADWSLPQTFPFSAKGRIDFDDATVVFENDKLSVYYDKEVFTETYDAEDAFVNEIEAFISMIIDNKPCDVTSPESIRDSVKIVMTELEASKTGETIKM